jgi:hypothetical protein
LVPLAVQTVQPVAEVLRTKLSAFLAVWLCPCRIKGRHFDLGRLMGPGYDTQDHWSRAAIAINR